MTQQPDSAHGAYYVSVRRDNGDSRLLLGPFLDDHAKALSLVQVATNKAYELDARAHWYAFGTARYDGDDPPDGILNKFFPELFGPRVCPVCEDAACETKSAACGT